MYAPCSIPSQSFSHLGRLAWLAALFLMGAITQLGAQEVAVTTRHAPSINGDGRVEGSVQMLLGEAVALNGGSTLTQDLLVPGTPTVTTSGNVIWQGAQAGSGATTPAGYAVRLNGGAALRYVRTRTNAVEIPSVPALPATSGTRSVTINQPDQSAGDFSTLRDLTLNGNVGSIVVPAGTYRNFTANGGSGFILGVAGAAQPAIYSLQNLTLNGQAAIQVVGPVILHLANGLNVNGQAGVSAHPEWLQVKVVTGGVTINGGAILHGSILAPSGEVKINGQGELWGTAMCDSFRLNGGGLVKWGNTSSGGGGNQAPVATPQSATTAEDVAKPIVFTGTDADGDTLSFTVTSQPAHGAVSGAGANVTYTPFPDYFGPDSFTFTAHDGTAASVPATVSLTVTPVNDAPIAQAQTVSTTEDTPANLVLAGTDVDGDVLTYAVVTGPLHGALSGSGPNRTYTPAANYYGPDSFTFRVNDGTANSATATVTITVSPVQDVPVAGPLSVTTPEDQWVGVTLAGSDADGQPLTFQVATTPQHGTLSGTVPNLVYTPAANYHGPDAFTYYASDATASSAPANVSINVTPVNDPPVAAALTVETNEDTAVAATLPAIDADGDALTYLITAGCTHGTLSGAAPNLLYTPEPNFFGTDSVTFTAHDATNSSAPAVVTFIVQGQPDAPTANAQAVALNEDTAATVLLTAQDADGDPLLYSIVTGPAHGTLAATADPAAFAYIPDVHYHGSDGFTFKVNDGSADSVPAMVTLAITPVRDIPDAAPFAFTTPEDQPAAVTLIGVDFDGYDLLFTVLAPPQHGTLTGSGTELTYIPAADYHGPDSFYYIASDPYGDSDPALVTITVTPVNDAPVAAPQHLTLVEDGSVAIVLAATDVENDALTYRIVTEPAHGTLTADSQSALIYHYTPFPNYTGPDGFAFVAHDGRLDSAPATIALLVTPANDAPVASPMAFTTREDTPLAIALRGSDSEGTALSFSPAVPSHGTLIPDVTPGTYLYSPPHDFHGTDTFTFTVSDGQLVSLPASVTIEVTRENDAPAITASTPTPITAPTAITLQAVATDDGDPAGSVLTVQWSKVSGPGAITFADPTSPGTTASYTLAGTYVLRATASDGALTTSSDVTVTIIVPNQPPVVNAGPAQSLVLAASANLTATVQDDSLPTGATVTQQWSKLSGPGTVTFGNSASLATSATFSTPGDYVLRLRASDSALVGQDEITIHVIAPNAPPQVSTGPAQSITLGTSATLSGSVTDDGLPRGTGLFTHWSLVSGPGSVTFADPFSPATTAQFSASGEYTLHLTANDTELSASAEVQITVVAPANQAPIAIAGPDQSHTGTRLVHLLGSVSDDGLPLGAPVTIAWSRVSGPGAVTFAHAAGLATTATFGLPGTYVLRLSASDSQLAGTDDVAITVAFANQAPTVDASSARTVRTTAPVLLSGTVTDDGLPGSPLAIRWEKISGPGDATFAQSHQPASTVTFSEPGVYVLRLSASDSELSGSAQVSITFDPQSNGSPTITSAPLTEVTVSLDAPGGSAPAFTSIELTPASVGSASSHVFTTLPTTDPALFGLGGTDVRRVNFDTRPDGSAIASGSALDNEYASLGVVMNGVVVSNGVYGGAASPPNATYTPFTPGLEIAFSFTVPVVAVGLVNTSPDGNEFRFYSPAGELLFSTRDQDGWPINYEVDRFVGARSDDNNLIGSMVLVNSNFGQIELDELIFEVSTAQLPDANYTYQVTATDPEAEALTYSLLTAPAGMTIGSTTGLIAWHMTSADAGDHEVVVQVQDAAGLTNTQHFTLRIVANAAPVVNAGADVTQPEATAAISLAGQVSDEGLPAGSALALQWSKAAGPGTATFSASQTATTTVTFSQGGAYTLRLSASDGEFTTSDLVNVQVGAPMPANLGPSVDAGTDRTVAQLTTVTLAGNATDDGMPSGALTSQWTQLSGPSVVTFSSATSFTPTVSFSASGTYVLRLSVSDGQFTTRDQVVFTVYDAPTLNQPPTVFAGPAQTLAMTPQTLLAGTVADDGIPAGMLTARWSVVSGPGSVVFGTPYDAATSATFAAPGTYVLRLTASDSEFSAAAEMSIAVLATGPVNRPPGVNAGSDLSVAVGGAAPLAGTIADDGLPAGGTLAPVWRKLSGPGTAVFADGNAARTLVQFDAPGAYVLALSAWDGALSGSDTVTVTVLPAGNQAPGVNAGVDRSVPVGQLLTVTPAIEDDGLPSGGLSVLWSVLSGPGAATLHATNEGGVTAHFARFGSYVLRATVDDGEFSVSDEVSIDVTPVATVPPIISASAPASGTTFPRGQRIVLSATATDPDPSGGIAFITFSDGVTLLGTATPDAAGHASFTWTDAAIGAHTLTVVVTDTSGTTSSSTPIVVNVTPAVPGVALSYPLAYSAFGPGESITVQATASPGGDGSLITQVEFLVDGSVIGVDSTAPYATTWTVPTVGEHILTARATDALGQAATSAPALVRAVNDPSAPTIVELEAPLAGSTITGPTPVMGTVESPSLRDYRLEYRQVGATCDDWVTFATGSASASNTTLATFDPTQLLNGIYELRLVAREALKTTYSANTTVVVDGDMKVGEFTFSTQDLSIQLPGLSLDISRTYHSTKKCADDFGPGWDLDINAVRLFKNAKLGADWFYDIFVPENFLVPPSYSLADGAPHIVAIVFPNGQTYRFRPILALKSSGFTGFTEPYGNTIGQTFLPFTNLTRLKIAYQPLPGSEGIRLLPKGYRATDPDTHATTTIAGDADLFLGDPAEGLISLAIHENDALDAPLVDDVTGFDMVMPDGRTFAFGSDGRLERLTDRNGHWVEVRADGVFHSTGPAVTWTRDAQGRVTGVQDLRGGKVEYLYDTAGALVGVKDRAGGLTSYEYEPASAGVNAGKLKRILDPSGLPQLGNEYQPDGRLFLQRNAANNALVRSIHNLTTRTEQMVDPLGKITTLTYDASGRVTESRDPLGNTTRFAYDEAGRRIAVENPLGHIQRFAFEQGQRTLVFPGEGPGGTDRVEHQSEPLMTKITDAEGAVFNYSYDAQGHPTQLTDALGHNVSLAYDAKGNVTAVTDSLGHVTTFAYNARGQITSRTDSEGQTTTYQYNAQGRMSSVADVLGHATAMTYDANGNEITRTTTRTRSDGTVETLTTTSEYDANDRLTKTVDPLGRESHTIYDANGRLTETVDPAGRSTRNFYDLAGHLIRTEYPDGTSTRTEYDLAGRVVKTIDTLNRETALEYDDAGRLVKTTAPDGAQTTTVYDAAGRVVTTTDAAGRTTGYDYDRAGRRTLVRDPLGNETAFAYDANGNLLQTEDALGRATTYGYDALNRRTTTTFPDGRSQSVAYDDLGRVSSETDQAGRTRSYAYDALGRVLEVTDALNQTTAYTYDELGNPLTQVDALGRTTRYSYDNLGRRVKRTLPLGMFETLGYDTSGNLATRADFQGRTTTYQYDALNRLTAKVPDLTLGEPSIGFTYTAAGRRATMTDGTGLTTYTYDTRDRLVAKTTPQGTLTYTYNGAGELTRLASEQTEGIETSYAYDGAGRLGSVTDRELGTTAYSYDAVGNLTQFTTPNGVSHSYAFDPLNRLTQILVASVPATGPPVTLASYTYTLSPSGRRDGVHENGAGLLPTNPTGTRSVTWLYDALDRLTRETIAAPVGPAGQTTYGYDAVGNRLSRTSTMPGLPAQNFSYDANDRLTTHGYDANGNTTSGRVPQPVLSQVPSALPGETTVADGYDFEDRLKSRTGGGLDVTVFYNGDGQRVAEVVAGQTTTYLVDELNPTGYAQVVEERTNGTVTRTYTYGHDLLAQDTRESGHQWRAQFFGYDGHGSVRFLTDELGAVSDTYSYDAFGTLLTSSGTTANRYRYAGEEFAPELGLYHLRARWLNAAHGRFWTADTYEGQATDPASLHRYSYAHNNPTNLSDPSGHTPTLAGLMCNLGLQLSSAELAGETQGAINKLQYAALHPGATKSELERAYNVGYAFGASTDLAFGVALGVAFAPVSLGKAAVTLANSFSTIQATRVAAQSATLSAEGRTTIVQSLLKQGYSRQFVQELLRGGANRTITNLRTVSAEEANAPFIAKDWSPPYATGANVRTFTTESPTEFVRVHTESNPTGAFLVRADEIAGMTPAQIQQHLALPSVPTHIRSVIVPPGTPMQVGKVGAQPSFGVPNNGGFQYQLMGRIPDNSFGPSVPLQ
jgi:RHS repeat-associated protein